MATFLTLIAAASLQAPVHQRLIVDPLLITMVEEVWEGIGKSEVWPGWDPRSTPILIYLPDKQDLLINHPKPPVGFEKYLAPMRTSLGDMYVRNGKTLLDNDGQNTSMDVNGVETLVVADTLSTRRQWIESLASALAERPYDAHAVISDGLYPDPYATMTLFAHEAFHVFQAKRAKSAGANELDLVHYPSLSVENNVGLSQEAELLSLAIVSQSQDELRRIAGQWLAVRQSRRKSIPASSAAYEDAIELNEGLAKYVEYRALEALKRRQPRREAFLIQGFHGFEDNEDVQKGLRRSMVGFLSGSNTVNNDLYGASPVRFRLYYSGMGAALLLDRLGVDWKTRALEGGKSLTELVESTLSGQSILPPDPSAELVASKKKFAKEGAAFLETALKEFDQAPGLLAIDYSALAAAEPSFAFTPFGILRIDEHRNIFRLIPTSGRLGAVRFQESSPRPVLWERANKRIVFQLGETPKEATRVDGTISVGGVTVSGWKGSANLDGKSLVIKLEK